MLPFLSAILLVNEGTLPWVADLQRHLQPMLDAKTKPLTQTRIEKAVRALGYNQYKGIVAQIKGAPGTYIASFGADMSDTCTLLIAPSGKVSLITHQEEREEGQSSCLSDTAQVKGNTLLLGGLIGWSGNGARYAFETYRLQGQRWTRTSRAETENECWGGDVPSTLLAGGSVQMRSRTYGKSVECCHATALVSIGETFRVRRGIVKRVGERRLDTAFNTLDNLAGALASSNTSAIHKIVPSKSLRRRLAKLWPSFGPGPQVECVNSVGNVDSRTYGWSRNGAEETIWLSFAQRSGRWVVTSIS